MSVRRRLINVSYIGIVGTGRERSKIEMSDRESRICRNVK